MVAGLTVQASVNILKSTYYNHRSSLYSVCTDSRNIPHHFQNLLKESVIVPIPRCRLLDSDQYHEAMNTTLN